MFVFTPANRLAYVLAQSEGLARVFVLETYREQTLPTSQLLVPSFARG